jgi:hypothetical protein
MLRAMRHVVRTVAAIRVAVSMRRDLLLEILALRHQLAVLARSNRRFRPSDRLLWLILRRMWPWWREALVLVRPATVDRWHRDWLDRRWWRHSRRPGRPRIDSQCRDLIGRLAEENRLSGGPRIRGELLKLGIVVSERTVSRYLRGRPRRPSQTWRTFLENHLGQFTLTSQVLSPYGPRDDVVDAFATTSCAAPPSRPSVWVAAMCAGRSAGLGPTHRSWFTLHSGSRSRPQRHATECRPCPTEAWMRAATHGEHAESRFVPARTTQLQPLTV